MIIRKHEPSSPDDLEQRAQEYGPFECKLYSNAGGLTQFGAYVVNLEPGSRSSDRHWHEEEDEFMYVLSGEATVVENDGAHVLHSGDAACWSAGVSDAHHVINQSSSSCSFRTPPAVMGFATHGGELASGPAAQPNRTAPTQNSATGRCLPSRRRASGSGESSIPSCRE